MPNKAEGGTVFVTVGTTLFEALIRAMTDARVLHKLARLGFDTLIIQYGKGRRPELPVNAPLRCVELYDFKETLTDDIRRADWIIGHAGAGTVSEVLSYHGESTTTTTTTTKHLKKRLVVVINTTLMHNHQTELAYAMGDRHHLHVVEEPASLLQTTVWDDIADFEPVPLAGGDPSDFPRMLTAFLDHR